MINMNINITNQHERLLDNKSEVAWHKKCECLVHQNTSDLFG